jgi:hypothetical protein
MDRRIANFRIASTRVRWPTGDRCCAARGAATGDPFLATAEALDRKAFGTLTGRTPLALKAPDANFLKMALP